MGNIIKFISLLRYNLIVNPALLPLHIYIQYNTLVFHTIFTHSIHMVANPKQFSHTPYYIYLMNLYIATSTSTSTRIENYFSCGHYFLDSRRKENNPITLTNKKNYYMNLPSFLYCCFVQKLANDLKAFSTKLANNPRLGKIVLMLRKHFRTTFVLCSQERDFIASIIQL